MRQIFCIIFITSFLTITAQIPVGLQIDSPQVVLFGEDTICCGSRLMWFPSKYSLFAGELLWPTDSIGRYSFSSGRSIAPGMLSASFGQSLVIGDYSFAAGGSGAIGNYSFATGSSTASGLQSAAVGLSGAGANNAFAAGVSSALGLASSALCNAVTTGEVSAAFNKAKADSYMCTALGRFNIGGGSPNEYVSTDPIFEIGIGSSEINRRNAFTVRKDGFISLGDHLGYTKFALYESGATTYGMGVQAGQFRFNLGNPQARFVFFDQPGSSAGEVFSIFGNGNILVNKGNLSLGSQLSNTKLALYESGGATYGMGVQAGQFRFNIGNPQARYAFFDQPGVNAVEIFTIYGNGTVAVKGTTVHSSDINRKEKIVSVSYADILEGLKDIPITEWQYKGQSERHIGPMAQDFYQAFGLGMDDKTISSIDADGVALAAIKALMEEVESLKVELQKVRDQLKKQ